MKIKLDARVVAFVKRVQVAEPRDVVEQFMKQFDACSDPNNINLALMLRTSRQSSVWAKERARQEQREIDSATVHCNS